MKRKAYPLLFIILFLSMINNVAQAQNDTVPLQIKEEIIPDHELENNNEPPCGIPCSYILDKSGNFIECLSPCCNCNELYRSHLIKTPISDIKLKTKTIVIQDTTNVK